MNAPTLRHELVPVLDLSAGSLDLMWRMAEDIAQSGLFGVKTAVQAMALMLVAQSEGRHPATITQDYDVIQNKAARKSHSVLARFLNAGGKVEWHCLTEQKAEATFSHPAGGSVRLDWTVDMAKRAGLAGKDNWKNYPRAMLRARLIAEGVRTVYPAAIGGDMINEEAMDLPGPTERFMGPVEEVDKTAPSASYPQADFDKNFPKWEAIVAKGRKSSGDLIAFIESAGLPLTEVQKARLNSVKREGAAPDAFTPPSFAEVAEAIARAKDRDALAAARDLIQHVAEGELRTELHGKADAREQELN